MVHYTCERCGYMTHHKSVFRKHLNRKRICPAILMDIPIDVIREALATDKNYGKSGKTTTDKKPTIDLDIEDIIDDDREYVDVEHDKTVINTEDLDPENGVYICAFCDMNFKRKYNCNRHQKNCKKRTDKIDELQEKIVKLEKMLDTRTNIVGNNNTIIDKQQNNIIINNYKSENTDYITNRVLEKILLMGPYLAVPRLMKYLHFNKKHTENHNLAITDIRSKFAHIRTNNVWQVRILNELLEELVSSKFNILDEYFEAEGREKIPLHKATSYETYRDKVSEDESAREQLKNKLFETMINFSNELGIVKNI